MRDSSDSSEEIEPETDSARWRRLLELLERAETRHQRDRDVTDAIWHEEQDRAERARRELSALIAKLPDDVARVMVEAVPRRIRWPSPQVVLGVFVIEVAAALSALAVGKFLALW